MYCSIWHARRYYKHCDFESQNLAKKFQIVLQNLSTSCTDCEVYQSFICKSWNLPTNHQNLEKVETEALSLN
jgi:hypothetical protein